MESFTPHSYESQLLQLDKLTKRILPVKKKIMIVDTWQI